MDRIIDMKLTTSLLVVLTSFSVNAQGIGKITVSGLVSAGVPVHAADIFLKSNEQVGTLTDTAGFFQLSIPKSLMYDTLVILAMGFERKEVPLSTIDLARGTAQFFLDQQSILLDEVLIESQRFDLKGLVLKSIASIPNNYPRKRHQLIGLYRKVSTNETGYTHLEEASLILEDQGYQNAPALVKIRTGNFRQTHDFGSVDSSYVVAYDKMHRNITQRLNTFANPLNKLYATNRLRNYDNRDAWLNLKRMQRIVDDHYTFELIDIQTSGSDTVYHIAFAASPVPPAPKKLSGRNYLKINANDLAIVEIQLTLGFEDQSLMGQDLIRFEKKHGTYYPAYIKTIDYRHINRNFADNEYDIRTIWIDDVRIKALESLKAKDLNDPNDPQSHKRRATVSGFWDTTQLIKRYPLEKAVKKDLEAHEALDEQFRDNAPDR